MTFLFDTFTDTDGTLLTDHTGEVGATWTQHPTVPGQGVIADNRVYASSGGIVIASGIPPTPDYDVIATVRYFTATPNLSIMGRVDPSSYRGYILRLGDLYRVTSGVLQQLDSFSGPWIAGTDYALRLEMRGDLIRGYVDDVLVCEATDSTITAAGVVGIRDFDAASPSTGKHIASIEAINFGSPAPPIPVKVQVGGSLVDVTAYKAMVGGALVDVAGIDTEG